VFKFPFSKANPNHLAYMEFIKSK